MTGPEKWLAVEVSERAEEPDTRPTESAVGGWQGGLLAAGCECPWEEHGYGLGTVRTTHHKPDCSLPGGCPSGPRDFYLGLDVGIVIGFIGGAGLVLLLGWIGV